MLKIKPSLGQPIIKYSIDAAFGSDLFDEIMVSTDDEEIAFLAEKYGAKVPFMRSKEASDDYATTADVIEEVLNEYIKRGYRFKYACCIYPTAPFVTAEKLIRSFQDLKESDADAVTPVAKFSYPIQRAFKVENGELVRMWPEYEKARSQDLTPAYHDVGQFYWHKVESFMRREVKDDYKIIPFMIPEMEMQDMDTEDDWKVAEFKYRYLQGYELKQDKV